MQYLAEILVFAVFAMSLNLLLGYAGQVSVSHAAFGAMGGYTLTKLVVDFGWPWWLALIAGIAVACLGGLLVGLPALRLSTEYLILLTMAVQTIVVYFVSASNDFGGPFGMPLGTLEFMGGSLTQPEHFIPWFAVLVVIVFLVCLRIGESPFGRVLKGIREDELLTRSLGKNVYRAKLIVFSVAAGLAGLAGCMYVILNNIATPNLFSFDQSMAMFAMVVIGGRANLLGSIVGAALLVLLTPVLEFVLALPPEQASFARMVVFGLALLLMIWIRPQGLLPERMGRGSRARKAAMKGSPVSPVPPVSSVAPASPVVQADREPGGEELVRVSGLSKSFGGIQAAHELDFSLSAGQITALIGPNGAGKTTVFNLLTGHIRADRGDVFLRGENIVGRTPDRIARLGMVRSYQDVRLVSRLSTLQNVMLAIPEQPGEDFAKLWVPGTRVSRGEKSVRAEAMAWLDFVGLADFAHEPASSLSFGDQKMLALSRTLATRADVLLLDEPASGIEGSWVERMLELIQRACRDGRTVCIVEHNLDVVRQIADDVIFLELGQITAQGSLDELLSDERLGEAYFGNQ